MRVTQLGPNEALLLPRCNSVHCCFMKISIDVLFLAADGEILYLRPNMNPWTFSPIIRNSKNVLECSSGTIARLDLQLGHHISFQTGLSLVQ